MTTQGDKRGAGQKRPLPTWVAFQVAATERPEAAAAWRERLRQVPREAVVAAVHAVPNTHMSQTARDFACDPGSRRVRLDFRIDIGDAGASGFMADSTSQRGTLLLHEMVFGERWDDHEGWTRVREMVREFG